MTQSQALAIMKTGVNIYLTGQAGSGKTYVLNEYIRYLREHDIPVAVTASTGIAATHMNGMTIHGFAGIGIREHLTEYDLDTMMQKPYLVKRFEKTRVLIIDEVSMLHARTLDMVDQVLQAFRRNSLPFGGLQVILSGDFFQLPPITRASSQPTEDFSQDIDETRSDLAIYSNAWRTMKPAICYLTEQHRQDDEELTKILTSIRSGEIPEAHVATIRGRMGMTLTRIVEPTRLYTHNVDVDTINYAALGKLAGKEWSYAMEHRGRDVLVEILKKSCLAHDNLRLKVGAQVMFIKNNPEKGYANGTRGTVIEIKPSSVPVVRLMNGKSVEVGAESWAIEEDGKKKAELMQLPLRLAWAITIHKSQGMSLDAAEIDLSKTFSYGMGYVALSRVRSLEGIRLVGFNPQSLAVDPTVLELDFNLQNDSGENEELFGKLTKVEQQKLEDDFIVRMGGSLKKVAVSKEGKKEKVSTLSVTRSLLEEKKSIKEIAQERGMTEGTIISHLEKLKELDATIPLEHLTPSKKELAAVRKVHEKLPKDEQMKLTPLKIGLEKAGYTMSFDEIRLARLFIHE